MTLYIIIIIIIIIITKIIENAMTFFKIMKISTSKKKINWMKVTKKKRYLL